MTEPTRLFLIRHALVEPSARATFYGSMDVALCDLALQEEAALYRWLAFRLPRPAAWICTNLARTRATAAAIFAAGYPDQPLAVEPDLAEQFLGEWQGIPHEALVERLRHPPHPFWPHAAEEQPPGGESFAQVQARVGAVLERIAEAMPAGRRHRRAWRLDPRGAGPCAGAERATRRWPFPSATSA